MAEFDPLHQNIAGRQAYRLQVQGTASASELSVVSFTATEAMGEPTAVIIEATHSELNICHEHGEATRALRKQMWGLHTNNLGAQDDVAAAYVAWSYIISQNTKNQSRKLAPVASLIGFLRTSPNRTYAD